MLCQLTIQDLAIIDRLQLDVNAGMTVLTGETGAGKSILLDALGLVLGDRADATVIRGGSERTDISAIFAITANHPIKPLLADIAIVSDEELLLRRVIEHNGRSRAYVNNTPVTIQMLRQIGDCLLNIHGQHAHQSLAKAAAQRDLLDQSDSYQALLDKVITTYQKWRAVHDQLHNNRHSDSAQLSLLKYQFDELAELDLGAKEYPSLVAEHKRLANAQYLLASCQKIYADLADSELSIQHKLSTYQRECNNLCKLDHALRTISELLDQASIQVTEASRELHHYITQFDDNQAELPALEARLGKVHDLARKHQVEPERLAEHFDSLAKQLDMLEISAADLAELQHREGELVSQYYQLADALHDEREKAAVTLAAAVTEQMQGLAMNGKFTIEVQAFESEQPQRYGTDNINFLVSTNPGQPLRPISKVASGGELSRLSLAIEIICSQSQRAPTMIFDEVDAGIGGNTAAIVGKILHRLAAHRQILCVTHLPQVAACADNHLQVIKTVEDGKTFTKVCRLDEQQRIDELARMLAGEVITDESRANAKRLLKSNR